MEDSRTASSQGASPGHGVEFPITGTKNLRMDENPVTPASKPWLKRLFVGIYIRNQGVLGAKFRPSTECFARITKSRLLAAIAIWTCRTLQIILGLPSISLGDFTTLAQSFLPTDLKGAFTKRQLCAPIPKARCSCQPRSKPFQVLSGRQLNATLRRSSQYYKYTYMYIYICLYIYICVCGARKKPTIPIPFWLFDVG